MVLYVALQEAQLPLRNRASAMHFFVPKLLSVAIMTYSYVSPPKRISSKFVRQTATVTNFSMRPQNVRMTRSHTCHLMSLF